MAERIHRNPQNWHWLGWPLTGPDAIANTFPVAGIVAYGDVLVKVAEGETCNWRVDPRECVALPENVIHPPRTAVCPRCGVTFECADDGDAGRCERCHE